jgi:hypothetical protein
MQESIFNLIPQHEQHTAALRRKTTSMVAEHVSVHAAKDDPHANSVPSQRDYQINMGSNHQYPDANGREHGQQQRIMASRQPSLKPRGAAPELEPAEVARRRQQQQMSGFAMASALEGAETYKQRMLKSKQVCHDHPYSSCQSHCSTPCVCVPARDMHFVPAA